jgi:hypothetical protein
MLNVITLSITMLNVITLNVITLNVIMLSVVAPVSLSTEDILTYPTANIVFTCHILSPKPNGAWI